MYNGERATIGAAATYIKGPRAGYPGEAADASAQFDVLVRGVQVPQTVPHAGRNSGQGGAAQQDPGAAHAEVLVELQRQKAVLLGVAPSRLPDEVSLEQNIKLAQLRSGKTGLPLESVKIIPDFLRFFHDFSSHFRVYL